MCRRRTVFADYGPFVFFPDNITASQIYHRLDGKCHSCLKLRPSSLLLKVGDLGLFMKLGTYAVAYKVTHYAVAEFTYISVYGIWYIKEPVAGACHLDAFKKAVPGLIDKLLLFFRYSTHSVCTGSIRMISLVDKSRIYRYYISFMQDLFLAGYSMYHLIIYRYTDLGRKSLIVVKVWYNSVFL